MPKTALVLAGGGSFGAIQVGMLRELVAFGIRPDLVVGSSVGALNGAYFAGDPSPAGVARLEEIWCGLKRKDVFPLKLRRIAGLLFRELIERAAAATRQWVRSGGLMHRRFRPVAPARRLMRSSAGDEPRSRLPPVNGH